MTGLDVIWAGIGGGAGALLRWGVGKMFAPRPFPLSTFVINVSGAFVIAYLSTMLSIRWQDRYDGLIAALILTGVLGGYTTFSSMQLDAIQLSKSGKPFLALFYLVASVGAGLLAAGLGVFLAQY